MVKNKNASLDALAEESASPIKLEEEISPRVIINSGSQKAKGRPKKLDGVRHQLPTYIPEALYFELLDWVNLQKRSNKSFSLNDIIIEAMELWLKSHGRPSIQELIDKSK